MPQTVNVLSESLIEETASARLGDALRFVPGASRDGSDLDAFGDQYMVRGFGVSQTVNGVATAELHHARHTANVERTEVLKGRSEERRDGKGWVRMCRFRWGLYHAKKK